MSFIVAIAIYVAGILTALMFMGLRRLIKRRMDALAAKILGTSPHSHNSDPL